MRTSLWLLGLVVTGVLVRAALVGSYVPLTTPDAGTYLAAARDLVFGDFSRGEGRRTPGYPLFILLVGESPERIALAQMAAGIGMSILLFFIGLRMTHRPGVAFAIGLSYHLNLQQLFLEAALMNETLSSTMVVATVAALIVAIQRLRDGQSATGIVLLTGAAAAAAIMVRPQFIFLLLLLPLLLIYAATSAKKRTARAIGVAALVVLPGLATVLGWMAVVQAKTGYFTLSTQSGFGLVNHSVEFIELAPEKYAMVRDILLKHRAARIAASGDPSNTIWYALPEIRQVTGWSLPEASRQMQTMSTQMFAEHPMRYAFSVARPWLEFWTVPIFWEPDRIAPAWLAKPLEKIWWVEHKLLRLTNLLFVILVTAVVVSRRVREAVRWDLEATAISAVILASSLLQAMADRGAGSRYAVTIQALVLLVVVVSAVRWRIRAAVPRSSTVAPPISPGRSVVTRS